MHNVRAKSTYIYCNVDCCIIDVFSGYWRSEHFILHDYGERRDFADQLERYLWILRDIDDYLGRMPKNDVIYYV